MASDLKPSDFVHLHTHTHHSLLDGLSKIEPLIDRVKELGMEAVAITDHGTMSGAIEFYKAAKSRGIKPIIGMEAYVANRGHQDKDPASDRERYHLILLAMNFTGYQNLMRLSTIASIDGFYYKPRIDRELLVKYNEGLIATSACLGSEIGEHLRAGREKDAIEAAKWYAETFHGRFYLEFQDHDWKEQLDYHEKLLSLAHKLSLPCIVTADSHYLLPQDQEAHEVLLCVQTGSSLSETDRFSLKETPLYLKDPHEIIDSWGVDHPDFITNTKGIADQCNLEIPLGEMLLPTFPVREDQSTTDILMEKTYRGLVWRYKAKTRAEVSRLSVESCQKLLPSDVLERAEYELGVIYNMGFDSYFLIVSDFIQWGKDKGIVFGPGRGSTAGSIVAYALNITDLDPLKYDLLFERFLNPDRISMPDADIDIQDNRRDEVIEYVADKYGHERVAHIVTFGTMAARNAIRDVARVLDLPYGDADRMAKMIPPPVQGRHTPLKKHLEEVPELASEYAVNEASRRVIDLAVKLEGTIRSHGVHAAGIVIAPDDIVNFAPLEMAQKGVVATQYSMNPIEDIGLVKIDFLGLSNLTVIKNALRIIRKVYDQDIDINSLPLDDQQTFDLFQKGDTTGVFQFESAGMKRYLKSLKPNVFDDITAMGALYRPGPMQWIDDFIARKHGQRKIEYLHTSMEPALKSTYGVIVYQEQVMQISKDLCGFTGGQADTLRKGIGKKIPEVLAKMKTDFIEGGIKTSGAERGLMEKLWRQLEDFAAYCFNKSHAACYAMISYWTAYLKAHYPAAFMAALLTSDYDNTDRLTIEITECRNMGIEVMPPDINESFHEFAIVPNTNSIRYGLDAIKNVGVGAIEMIIAERDKSGHFQSVADFVERVGGRVINKKIMESLIKSGAFDSLEPNRQTLLLNLDNLLAYASRLQKDADSTQADLFGGSIESSVKPVLQWEESTSEVPARDKLAWERELLGVYLSAHPLQDYRTYLEAHTTPISSIKSSNDGKRVAIGGMVTTVREITTKTGGRMAFVGLVDTTGELELIVFPGIYSDKKELLQPDQALLVEGKISTKDREGRSTEEIKILVESVEALTSDLANSAKTNEPKKQKAEPVFSKSEPVVESKPADKGTLYIRIHDPDNHALLKSMKQAVSKHPGSTPVVVVLDGQTRQAIKLPFGISSSDEALSDLRDVLPIKDVVLQ